MSWWLVLIILLAGWLLVFLEVFIIPGTMLFAIIGTLTMLAGVVISFATFGVIPGILTLTGTAIFTFLSIVFGFKSGVLSALTLKTTQDGKVNLIDESKIKIGDTGVAQSKIGPMGKALIQDSTYEVQTLGEWINSGAPIEVTKVSLNKIIVKAKT